MGLGWERYQKSGGSHKYTNASSIVWRTAIERAPIFSYILFGNLLHIASHPLRRADPLAPLLIPFSILLPMDQVLYMYAVSLVSSVRLFSFLLACNAITVQLIYYLPKFFLKGGQWKLECFSWNDTNSQVLWPQEGLEWCEREKKGEREKREKMDHDIDFILAPCCQGSMTWEDLFSKVCQDIC